MQHDNPAVRPYHEIVELFKSLDANEKALLRELYKHSDPKPIWDRSIDPAWVRRHGFYTEGPAIRRHIDALVARGFLVPDPAQSYTWRCSLNPDVQHAIVGKRPQEAESS